MPMNENTPDSSLAIEVRGLTKSFGTRPALRGIHLNVHWGERLVIFGPNGAGKTTLVKIIATLVKPSSGSVRLDGIDIRDSPAQIRQKIGVVSHQNFLYNDLSIFENLKFYGRMYDVPNLESRIQEVVARVQLESRLHDRFGTLSHGLQQRVSIARAILHEPPILILDEPEVGLDPSASAAIDVIINNLNAGDRTVVMTSHNLERGLELGNRIAILNQGNIVYQASKEELIELNLHQVYNHYTETNR